MYVILSEEVNLQNLNLFMYLNLDMSGWSRRDYKTDAFPTYIPISSTKKFCDEFDIMIGRYGPPIFQICRGLKGAYNVALLKVIPKEGVSRDFYTIFWSKTLFSNMLINYLPEPEDKLELI